MSFVKSTAIFGVLALLSKVQAHGYVTGVVAGGEWFPGFNPSSIYMKDPPVVAGWTTVGVVNKGFVNDYSSPDIICHKGASPGGTYLKVAAGSSIDLQWSPWPEGHHGPVLDFLAACGDDCMTVDKTNLLFNKIDEGGLVDSSKDPVVWASDELIANNNTWSVKIPANIAPGKYVLRHDIIALHIAFNVSGAQAYPQCFNLEITGSGTNTLPSGTKGTDLYHKDDPGMLINIYYPKVTSYTIPGPPLIDGTSSGPQPVPSVAASSSTTSAVAATSAAVSSSTSTTKGGWGVDITASVTAPGQVISTSAVAASSSTTTTTTTTKASQPSQPATSAPSEPSTSQAPPPGPKPESSAAPPPPPPPPAPPAETVSPAEGNTGGNPEGNPGGFPGGFPGGNGGWGNGGSDSTSPVSFTSTVTGRIGRPTKFTCYIEE